MFGANQRQNNVVVLLTLIPIHCRHLQGAFEGESFVGLKFRYEALKAYFRSLIFVVCPEHIITVAYYLRYNSNVWIFVG